jgi:hypothetical protein
MRPETGDRRLNLWIRRQIFLVYIWGEENSYLNRQAGPLRPDAALTHSRMQELPPRVG